VHQSGAHEDVGERGDLGGARVHLAAVDGREPRAGGEDGGDDVRVGAQSRAGGGQELAGEEGEGEGGVRARQAGDESGVGA
jgi:hypothetical protein